MLLHPNVLWLFSVLVQSVDSLEWSSVTVSGGSTPSARRDMALGYFQTQSKLVVFGGRGGPILDDTWEFDIAGGTWADKSTTTRPGARFSMVYGVVGNFLYITTGEGPGKLFYNDVWRFDVTTSTWTQVSTTGTPPSVRYGAVGGVYPGSPLLYVNLGFAGKRYFDTLVLNTSTNQWSTRFCEGFCHPYDPNYPHARCLHSGAVIDANRLAIFGGCLSGGQTGGPCPAGDSWIFKSAEQEWTELPPCASPRTYSSMALLPEVNGQKRVVLYGGIENDRQVIQTSEAPADTVAVLDADSMSWTYRKTTTSSSFPAKRASAAMVSTATGIYLFGGMNTETKAVMNDIWFLSGNSSSADQAAIVECASIFTNFPLVHGILMFLGWGVCLVWGTFIARYFSSSGTTWFLLHRIFQVSGLVLSVIGLVMGIVAVQFDHFKFAHGAIGIIIMLLGLSQPFNALIRPHRPEEGEKKTLKRRIWELFHHNIGRVAVALALVNISLGVFLALAHTAVWALWFVYLIIIILVFLFFELLKIEVVHEKLSAILPLKKKDYPVSSEHKMEKMSNKQDVEKKD
ncbi:uncharacterized protein LOC134257148 [Saccostrea cucullata]|uniref:uncharacterized protein LOC134257148 n=1 Tax=Saccostrea cuccullata TaxID=36930 RepID=UPI002ED6AC1C